MYETIKVVDVIENEDGSSTVTFDIPEDVIQELFQHFLLEAIIRGIKYTKELNEKETSNLGDYNAS